MIVAIGSKNKAKVQAIETVFQKFAKEVIACDVPSLGSKQPFSDEEARIGAINCAQAAFELTKGTLGLGLEGGVDQTEAGLVLCNWGALYYAKDRYIIACGARRDGRKFT